MNELSKLGGPVNLFKFGLFRRFVQDLIDKTRNKVCNCRKDAMLGAFRASTAESMCDFTGNFDLTLMFNKRQYKTHLKS